MAGQIIKKLNLEDRTGNIYLECRQKTEMKRGSEIIEKRKKRKREKKARIEKVPSYHIPFSQSDIPDFFFQRHFKGLPLIPNCDGELYYGDHWIEVRPTL